MEETSAQNSLVMGSTLSATKPASELDRCFSLLSDQIMLIRDLDARLSAVLHRSPEKDSEQGDLPPHISTVAETISRNNSQLKKLISDLAI